MSSNELTARLVQPMRTGEIGRVRTIVGLDQERAAEGIEVNRGRCVRVLSGEPGGALSVASSA
jgi:hypothetical protein